MDKSKNEEESVSIKNTVSLKKSIAVLRKHPPYDIQEKFDDSSPIELSKDVDRQEGVDPTRYGDWERNGRCIDF